MKNDEIERLVQGLSPERARAVLERLAGLEVTRPEREAALRAALSRAANTKRTQHARRLFTDVLAPVLATDSRAQELGSDAPGLVTRADAAALWSLTAETRPAVVTRIQDVLSSEAARAPLSEILTRDTAVGMADELCSACVAALDELIAGRPKGALERVEAVRSAESRRRGISARPRPWSRADLLFLRDLLALRDIALPVVTAVRKGTAAPTASQSLAAIVVETERSPVLAALVPLTMMNIQAEFRDACSFLALVSDGAVVGVVLAGLARHLTVAAEMLGDRLATVGGSVGSGPLAWSEERGRDLRKALMRFSDAMGAAADLDLLKNPRVGAQCRDALASMMGRVEKGPYRVLMDRVEACSRAHPAPDHAAVVSVLGMLNDWRSSLSDQIFWGSAHTAFRSDVEATLAAAFKRALAPDGHQDTLARFGHLQRIEELARGMGSSTARWLEPPGPGFVRVATDRLGLPAPLHPIEADLIRVSVEAAKAEMALIRHWRDPALLALSEAAARRGDL
ncbi:hypothetical protein [Arenibaculum pallidiluteum]|uniref:hypothetical protein n=1 Tax=Arenibaculum pallidiluteum TaxID=2812559 RepID=UPI001A96A9B6|nr:hypothetical protein [Arenibaculum pallidiluteum]